MRDHFIQMADYTTWANKRIYDAARTFNNDDIHKDVGAYFTSLHGTLTHILIADQLWMARLQNQSPPHNDLDIIPFDNFDDLTAARCAQDKATAAFINTLVDDDYLENFKYKDMEDNPHTLPRRTIITHMFNHGTHHRGQAHHILKQLRMDEPPALDLPCFALDLV
jgi:uncharacterized damage-inducible protein DinB